MRLWTLHPKYLDAQGLVALWREGLLAQAVLRGQTRGYRHHPQLDRFRTHDSPRRAIGAYLGGVLTEAGARGYAFDRQKVSVPRVAIAIDATDGQLSYEWSHLMHKLKSRNPALYRQWKREPKPSPHPLFRIVQGGIEPWERTS
jgi:hypothetical protein